MRSYWTKEEEDELRHYYEDIGLSVSELYNDFIKKYPHRTIASLKLKIVKLGLRHTKEQKFQIRSRLNKGKNNGLL